MQIILLYYKIDFEFFKSKLKLNIFSILFQLVLDFVIIQMNKAM